VIDSSEELLDPHEVASWLKVAEATLRQWVVRGQGPRVIRVGGVMRYRRGDIEAWLDQQTVDPAMRTAS
jgi:predicted DNA-binding transcriptional regulator AlpA